VELKKEKIELKNAKKMMKLTELIEINTRKKLNLKLKIRFH